MKEEVIRRQYSYTVGSSDAFAQGATKDLSFQSEIQSKVGSKLGIEGLASIGSEVTGTESQGVVYGRSVTFSQQLTEGASVQFEVEYRRITRITLRVP